jgi:hypothetical protein
MMAYNVTKGTCLAASVRVADSFLKRLVGLLGKRSLAHDGQSLGLWITPCNSIHTLGMLFSIDVLFLNRSGQVVKAVPGVKPFRLVLPVQSAVSVLELPEQTIGRTNTEPDDVIQMMKCEMRNAECGIKAFSIRHSLFAIHHFLHDERGMMHNE